MKKQTCLNCGQPFNFSERNGYKEHVCEVIAAIRHHVESEGGKFTLAGTKVFTPDNSSDSVLMGRRFNMLQAAAQWAMDNPDKHVQVACATKAGARVCEELMVRFWPTVMVWYSYPRTDPCD